MQKPLIGKSPDGRYRWVQGWASERIYREALRIVGLKAATTPPLPVLIEQFASHWRDDELEPELAFGPYRRDRSPDDHLEVNVLVKDARGVPDIRFSVSGSDLPLMTAHAIIILHYDLQAERCPILTDRKIELATGEQFRFVVQDLHEHDTLGNAVINWWLYKVWGREQEVLFEGQTTRVLGEDSERQANMILKGLCSGKAGAAENTDQLRFRKEYAAELASTLV